MKNPERIIFVPLGDKAHGNLERAASYEAWKLSQDIHGEEESKGRMVAVSVESLQKHPRVNPFYYLKKGMTTMGGYLVKVKELDRRKA